MADPTRSAALKPWQPARGWSPGRPAQELILRKLIVPAKRSGAGPDEPVRRRFPLIPIKASPMSATPSDGRMIGKTTDARGA